MHFDPTLFFAILAGILLLVGLVGNRSLAKISGSLGCFLSKNVALVCMSSNRLTVF